MGTRCKDPKAISLTKTEAMSFDTPREMLPKATLDAIDLLLSEAPCRLMRSKTVKPIADYIMLRTDLTDCHLSALNEIQRFQSDPEGGHTLLTVGRDLRAHNTKAEAPCS